MEIEDAITIMQQLSRKLENVVALEDMVSPFAEFLVHMQPQLSEEDFAFLGTIGAMIYLEGARTYNSSVQANLVMQKLRRQPETG